MARFMGNESHCSWETALNFFILSLVRGTTPLMIYFAAHHLHSAGLVVAMKCAISLVLFGISAVLLMKPAVRTIVRNNLLDKTTYFKLFIIGFLQSAVPYLLIAYSVKYVPITLVSVFMVITPWWIHLIEHSFSSSKTMHVPSVLKIGIAIGTIGIIVMIVPVFVKAVHCSDHVPHTTNHTNVTSSSSSNLKSKFCHSMKNVLNAIVALAVVPIMWGAAAVFWKKNQGEIHFVVASVGQNIFGCIIAAITWFILSLVTDSKPVNWNDKNWIIHVVYLGAGTGWLGTLLVRSLCSKVGSKTTNQVLTGIPLISFVEDCIFIRDVVTSTNILGVEMLGLILLTVGIFVSNIPSSDKSIEHSRYRDNLTEPLLTSENTDDGLSAGLNQILRNQIHQYEDNPMNDESEGYMNEDVEEPLFPPLDPEIKVNFPKLSEVS